MDLQTECCAKCGIPLFEIPQGSKSRKIFRSFATKMMENDVELNFCIDCYKNMNVKEERKEDD